MILSADADGTDVVERRCQKPDREGGQPQNDAHLEQFRILSVFVRFNHANSIDRILQDRRFDMAQRGDFARSAIGRFLNHMTGVPFGPLPVDLVATRSLIETLPPFVIHLATEISLHGFDDVTRVGMQTDATGFFQSLEAERRSHNFSLLKEPCAIVLSAPC